MRWGNGEGNSPLIRRGIQGEGIIHPAESDRPVSEDGGSPPQAVWRRRDRRFSPSYERGENSGPSDMSARKGKRSQDAKDRHLQKPNLCFSSIGRGGGRGQEIRSQRGRRRWGNGYSIGKRGNQFGGYKVGRGSNAPGISHCRGYGPQVKLKEGEKPGVCERNRGTLRKMADSRGVVVASSSIAP